ncbi:MAG TPA: hypothetical protein VFZ12_07290, partial [Dehalococcoidia bacterium]|nr:hypothetical protein [Dehalococcoidia bacterium]
MVLFLGGCDSSEPDNSTADETGDADFELAPAFGDLVLEGPTDIEPLPGLAGQYLVLEKAGRIRLLDAESGQVST